MANLPLDEVYDDLLERLHTVTVDLETSSSDLLDPSNARQNHSHFLSRLAKALDLSSGRIRATLLTVLADATRATPYWRSAFGLGIRCIAGHSRDLTEEQSDCVLEAARRVIAEQSGTISNDRSDQCYHALRIIANCCADDDINRSLVIHRDGIQNLMDLLESSYELAETLIPALYNVVNDFDEQCHPRTLPDLVLGRDNAIKATEPAPLDVAEYTISSLHTTSGLHVLQVLSKAVSMCPEPCYPHLAYLMSMSAIPGLCTGGTKCAALRDCGPSLCQVAPHLARQSTDCIPGVIQAVLSFASDSYMQNNLINVDSLSSLLQLRKSLDEYSSEMGEEITEYKEGFLRMVYALSTGDTYQELSKDPPLVEMLLTSLLENQHAEVWVFLCNAVSSAEQARALLSSGTLQRPLYECLDKSLDNNSVLPAIRLTTKLVLFPENQRLWPYIAPKIERLLTNNQFTLEIQHDAVTLLRLMLKGRPEYISSLVCSPESETQPLIQLSLDLFERTNDLSIKFEIGRLFTEIFRTMSSVEDSTEVVDTLVARFSDLATHMVLLIKEGPSAAARGEGWFGLALISRTKEGAQLVVNALAPKEMLGLLDKTPNRNGNFLIAKVAGIQGLAISDADRAALRSAVQALSNREPAD